MYSFSALYILVMYKYLYKPSVFALFLLFFCHLFPLINQHIKKSQFWSERKKKGEVASLDAPYLPQSFSPGNLWSGCSRWWWRPRGERRAPPRPGSASWTTAPCAPAAASSRPSPRTPGLSRWWPDVPAIAKKSSIMDHCQVLFPDATSFSLGCFIEINRLSWNVYAAWQNEDVDSKILAG